MFLSILLFFPKSFACVADAKGFSLNKCVVFTCFFAKSLFPGAVEEERVV